MMKNGVELSSKLDAILEQRLIHRNNTVVTGPVATFMHLWRLEVTLRSASMIQ